VPKRRTSDKQYDDISQTVDIIKLRDFAWPIVKNICTIAAVPAEA
jgi:hypothetical protein